jgi:hypothetical protein
MTVKMRNAGFSLPRIRELIEQRCCLLRCTSPTHATNSASLAQVCFRGDGANV